MIYMGSKARIAKYILPIILKDRKEGQWYVEPFAGGMNTICMVDGNRIASDANKYLIEMWRAIQNGVDMTETITKEMYHYYRIKHKHKSTEDMHLIGWIGFMASFRGKMFAGYALTDGIVNCIEQKIRNVKKQVIGMHGVNLYSCEYNKLVIPPKSIIYCDPPYRNTTGYKTSKGFDHDLFYEWCKKKKLEGHSVFISELQMPEPFTEIWSKPVKNRLSLKTTIDTVEKLYTL